ncbi:MAG TPA: MauE/DoxX family redox-associated membrane protein [Steroidobacteraceae bacterium]
MTLDPAVGLLLVATFALLFGSAAVHKLRDWRRFDEIFSAYGLVPAISRWRLSWLVPVLELGAAVGLLVDASRPFAVVVGMLLLLAYAAAIGVNLRRGRRDLACGCGGPDERRPIAPWMVWRNILLALGLAGTLARWTGRPLVLTDAVTVTFGLLTLALVYLCIDQLMGYMQRAARDGPAHLRGSR